METRCPECGTTLPAGTPAWVRQLMSRANRRPGAGGGEIVTLGHGTFVAPLPGGWLVHPGRPQCCFQTRARIRAGPPVPPRCAGAPTTTVAPLTGKASRLLRPSIP